MKKVRITKESQESEIPNINGVTVGYIKEGFLHAPITVGLPAYIGTLRTSLVTEVISETKFKTENSTYLLEFLPDEIIKMKYFSENFKKIDFFKGKTTQENEKDIEVGIITYLRDNSFHMSDDECKEMVDEFLIIHPELLLFRGKEFYYECC